MQAKNILLLSASRAGQMPYLAHALPYIRKTLAHAKRVIFIPFAGVSIDYDAYSDMVRHACAELNIEIISIHEFDDKPQAIATADAIFVGGGNTFRLLERLYHFELLEPLRAHVDQGKPYVGWSAGSNVAGETLCTTNDMPIIQPPSFEALNLVPLQLNPHYTNWKPEDHNGETRLQRLEEFMQLSPQTGVLALPEGTALKVDGEQMQIWGSVKALWLKHQQTPQQLPLNTSIEAVLT